MPAAGARHPLFASLALGLGGLACGEQAAVCPGMFDAQGIGRVSLVPAGWAAAEETPYPRVLSNGTIHTPLNSRGYFAAACTPGAYNNSQYLALDLRGKTLVYTADMSGAGCGCNAAVYLTSMRQNDRVSECGDHYCDANNVCGESCAEIDIQEGNLLSWHSTLHSSWDHKGLGRGFGGGGYGWNGPRDFGAAEFGPNGKCVNTNSPFEVSAHFRANDAGRFEAMEITLTQHGRNCPLWISVSGYSGIGELDAAFAAGMTPIVSYWSSGAMGWMDGKGADGQGPCYSETQDCAEAVRFYNFSVTPAFTAQVSPPTSAPAPAPARLRVPAPPAVSHKEVHSFVAGGLSMLAAQILIALGVWLYGASRTHRGGSVCDAVTTSPLRRAVAGSSQSLLMLAESGGRFSTQGAQESQEPPPAQRPSVDGLAGV